MIYCREEFQPDVFENFLCDAGLKKVTILQRMFELVRAFATQKFCMFWKPISSQILHQGAKNINNFYVSQAG